MTFRVFGMNTNFNLTNEPSRTLDVFKEEISRTTLKFKDNKIYESILRMWQLSATSSNLYLIVFMKEIAWDRKWFQYWIQLMPLQMYNSDL